MQPITIASHHKRTESLEEQLREDVNIRHRVVHESVLPACRPQPHPRSTRGTTALANWRGASVGVEAAEALILERKLIEWGNYAN